MFTFSFSSAFAKTTKDNVGNYDMMQISDYLYSYDDEEDNSSNTAGMYGVTDGEKAGAVDYLENVLAGLNKYSAAYAVKDDDGWQLGVYAGKELSEAIDLTEKVIENAKAAKTSKSLDKIQNKYWDAMSELECVTLTDLTFSGNTEEVVLNVDTGSYLLPGYGYFDSTTLAEGIAPVMGYGTTFEDRNSGKALLTWMFDNGYATITDMKSKSARGALEDALELVSDEVGVEVYTPITDETDPFASEAYYEYEALVDEVEKVKVTELDTVYELYNKVDEFLTKYGPKEYSTTAADTLLDAIEEKLEIAESRYKKANFENDWNTIQKLRPAKYAENKETIVAFAEKVLAFEEKYGLDIYGECDSYLSDVKKDKATVMAGGAAYEEDVRELLDGAYDMTDYFDAFAKDAYEAVEDAWDALNVIEPEKLQLTDKANFEAFAKAYDAYKAEVTKDAYEAVEINRNYEYENNELEAYILAGKANLETLSNDVDEDAVNAQQLLNNATLKVTTTALGNSKIKVNAKMSNTEFTSVLTAAGSGSTVEYKFYYKKAANSTYKFTKTKKSNYITYTKKSLKKGTKYNFRVGVVVKDADGKVVAEKSYKASGLGIRVCK